MEPKAHILYIDDEAQNLVTFRSNFRRQYEVHSAQSGEEAYAILRSGLPIELIVSDQRMPGMTGVQFFEKILPEFPDPIRIVMTAYSDIEAVTEAINKGKVYYFLTKPFKYENEMQAVIEKGIQAYRLTRENLALQREKESLLLQTARLEKERVLAQLQTLKNQVNPHFLFNSLNVLSSLIHEDGQLAELFITRLTRVYRYVLELKEAPLVSLDDELRFIESYVFLLQVRFGESLHIYTQAGEEALDWMLPPLTLQLLVENAVKHNVASRERPLSVEIFTQGERLVVRNNYQPRPQGDYSAGIGQQNLRERYALLGAPPPGFGLRGDAYEASMPLLPPPISGPAATRSPETP